MFFRSIIFGLKCIIVVVFFLEKAEGEYALIHAENNPEGNGETFCMVYNPAFNQLPSKLEDAQKSVLADLTPGVLCEDPGNPPVTVQNATWAVQRGNCTFTEKARIVQKYGGNAVLVVSDTGMFEPSANQTSDYQEINITVAIVDQTDFQKIQELGNSVTVQLYEPPAPKADYNLILIWLLAVGTVAVGGYVSGINKHKLYMRRKRTRSEGEKDGGAEGGSDGSSSSDDIEDLDVSPLFVVVFVIVMCGMLVALYFFYDYLVYVIIAMFALACSTSLYSTLQPFMHRMTCIGTCKIPSNRIPVLKRRPEIRNIVLGLVCLSVGVIWAVFRNASWAWILQDTLGVIFCIQVLKVIRLSSLKVITILLVLLFAYDIFFVFITPLFTKKGDSIMVKVATGGKSKEMLPMVFKVPRFIHSTLLACSGMPYSLLGFGDVMVPGLLVSYCHGFDLRVSSKRIYFIASVIAYGAGLLITFAALALMKSGQPALLYLVPCTLLTTIFIALCRKELRYMWNGKLGNTKSSSKGRNTTDSNSTQKYQQNESENEGDGIPGSSQESGGNGSLENCAANKSPEVNSLASDCSDEQQSLLANKP